MSKAHINSSLTLSNAINACDGNTTFSLTPDSADMYSDEGIAPIANVTTFLKGDGVFTNAFTVEDGTTNIWNQKYNWSTPADGATNAVYYNITTSDNCSYTVSADICIYQDDGTVNPRTSIYIYYSDGTFDSKSIPHTKDGVERRIITTVTANAAKTVSYIKGWVLDHSTGTTNKHSYANNIQIEKKAFGTSFVAGTRNAGVLRYNKNIINPTCGTMSFWFNPLSNIGGQYPQIMGIGWWSSPISRDWLGLYHDNATWKNGIAFSWYCKNGSYGAYSLGSASDITSYSWYYIACTWDYNAKQMFLYLYKPDGTLLKTGGVANLTALPDFMTEQYFEIGRLGNSYIQNAMYCNIKIDNIARTEQEIDQMYKSQSPYFYSDDYSAMA